jgi:hypothetical protein
MGVLIKNNNFKTKILKNLHILWEEGKILEKREQKTISFFIEILFSEFFDLDFVAVVKILFM